MRRWQRLGADSPAKWHSDPSRGFMGGRKGKILDLGHLSFRCAVTPCDGCRDRGDGYTRP